MSTKEEKQMLKEFKKIQIEKSNNLTKLANEAMKRADEKIKIMKEEHVKNMKLGDYLDILFPNDIKKVQQIYKLIKSKELNSESDIDKYLEKNKSNLKKDIQDTIKMVDSTKKPKKINTKNVSNAIELAQMMAKEPKYVSKNPKDEVKDTINEIEKLLKLLN